MHHSLIHVCICVYIYVYHQWLVHSLYGQKYWDTPFSRRENGISKLWQQRWKKIIYLNCISTSVATVLKCMKWLYPICTHMSLVFGDYTHTYIHTYIHTYTHIFIHVFVYILLFKYIYISGGPLSALTCCVNARLLSAIKKISPLIYSQSWVGSWVYTTQAMMTFTLIF